MTDWVNIFEHALWLIGAAVIFAAFSYSDWIASRRGVRLRQVLGRPAFQRLLLVGLSLISLALILLAKAWPERLVWLVFAGLFGIQLWQARRSGDDGAS